MIVIGVAFSSMNMLNAFLGPMGFGRSFVWLFFALTFHIVILAFLIHHLTSESHESSWCIYIYIYIYVAADASSLIFLLLFHLLLFSLLLYAQIPAGLRREAGFDTSRLLSVISTFVRR